MGRKGKFDEKPKKGPGRKARKQHDPKLPKHLQGNILHALPSSIYFQQVNVYCAE